VLLVILKVGKASNFLSSPEELDNHNRIQPKLLSRWIYSMSKAIFPVVDPVSEDWVK
jgi:hypothetical protein